MTVTIPAADELFGLFAIFCVGLVIAVFVCVLVHVVIALSLDTRLAEWLLVLRWPLTGLAFVGGIVWAVSAA